MQVENDINDMLYSPLRVGTFQHLRCNSWPLVHFLSRELSGVIMSDWQPTALRLRLMTRHIDLALLPSAELMNLTDSKIVGDCCIACNGVVRSVRLISKKPIEKISTLALDISSRSSVLMCEILLLHYFGLRPKRYRLDAESSLDNCQADAFVIIGNAALSYIPSKTWNYQYDLGSLWLEKTGLPFVFATWVSCDKSIWTNREYVQACKRARDRATNNIDVLLDEKQIELAKLPFERELIKSYLTDSIVYKLGDKERQGLQFFFDLALLHGFTKQKTFAHIIDTEQ
ncbi:MAG: menaquinone biosynthesis protein [Planctomycetaceae bacterium]|jgi:chorismate dehydratase|nr:menaquinone biosynthesis protein [Planctomycetaceae bacterium]